MRAGGKRGEHMDEKWSRRAGDWKLIGEALQPLFLVLSAIGAVVTFVIAEIDEIAGRHTEAKDRVFEARKPYLAKQLELYSATTSVVGSLLTVDPSDGNDYGMALGRWTKLYLSELPLFADHHCVTTQLAAVDAAIWAYYQAPSKDVRKQKKVVLENKACDLEFAMRSAVSRTWDTSQPGARNAEDAATACGPHPSTFVCPVLHQNEQPK